MAVFSIYVYFTLNHQCFITGTRYVRLLDFCFVTIFVFCKPLSHTLRMRYFSVHKMKLLYVSMISIRICKDHQKPDINTELTSGLFEKVMYRTFSDTYSLPVTTI